MPLSSPDLDHLQRAPPPAASCSCKVSCATGDIEDSAPVSKWCSTRVVRDRCKQRERVHIHQPIACGSSRNGVRGHDLCADRLGLRRLRTANYCVLLPLACRYQDGGSISDSVRHRQSCVTYPCTRLWPKARCTARRAQDCAPLRVRPTISTSLRQPRGDNGFATLASMAAVCISCGS